MGITEIFALSDVHGFFTPMKEALDKAGFDPEDESQLLVFCGDMFDRGHENRAVLDYLTSLPHKLLIRGNHDTRLNELLNLRLLEDYDYRNRTDETLTEFFGRDCIDFSGRLNITDAALADRLRRLYESEADYFEYGDYIFTHGWLPARVDGREPQILQDWRHADAESWKDAVWFEWQQMYSYPETALVPGKTVVCGHRPSAFGYMFDKTRMPDDYGIFYGKGVIAIDGWTVRSGQVNVLVLDV